MKRNRWKNRLSLLLVALMLFTTLAPVALAVGEPETVTKVDEPAEPDKDSENQNDPPAPAEEDKLEVGDELAGEPVAEGNETKIIFKNGEATLKTVSVTDAILVDKLGLQGASFIDGSIWTGIEKARMFVGWSDDPNYLQGDGHYFFDTHTFGDVQKSGLLKPGETLTLYAMYVGRPTVELVSSKIGIRINDDWVPVDDFVEPGDPVRTQNYTQDVDRTVAKYDPSVDAYKIKKLDAVFTMNPFVSAVVYRDAWNGALDVGSNEDGVMKNAEGDFTVIDLHVKLDERIQLPETFELSFTGYVFRPVQVFSGYNARGDYFGGEDNPFPILGETETSVRDSVQDNEPKTTFKVKSSYTDDAGKVHKVHDFVVRTRVRTGKGYDAQYGKRLDATMEEITSNMHLTFSSTDQPFTVSNDVAKAIAEGANPIDIRGHIEGQVRAKPSYKTYSVDWTKPRVLFTTASEIERLTFVKEEEPTPPTPPVVQHKTISVEKIWEDGNDEAKKRPDSITVKLLANGEDTGKRLVLSAKDNWKGSFYGLDYTKDGKTIEYTVAEIGVKDYESKVSGSDKSGYIITNTVVPEKPAPAPTPEIKLPKIPHITKPLVVPTIPKAGVGR